MFNTYFFISATDPKGAAKDFLDRLDEVDMGYADKIDVINHLRELVDDQLTGYSSVFEATEVGTDSLAMAGTERNSLW